jgi:hypothetical protein
MKRKNFDKIMSSGKQAQMHADHYLGFHLSGMPTYAAASGASRAAAGALAANPKDPALQADAVAKAPLVSSLESGADRGYLLRLATG